MSTTGQASTKFEPGAPASAGQIPLSVPEMGGREWEYVKACFDTGWVSSAGPFVEDFEKRIAAAAGTKHAVATSTGTAAIHLALLVAGVRPGDEVIVPSLTFIAPANAVAYTGARPVFVGVDDYWQLNPTSFASFLDERCEMRDGACVNVGTGRRVAAVLPVDLLGHPVDLDEIRRIAAAHALVVIEDATESLGARYRDRHVGAGPSIACFSFNGNKIVTTGGGGALVTDRDDWAARARYLSTQAKDDPIEYVHGAVGYNYRLTSIQAAMGLAQMEALDRFVEKRRAIAARYREELADLPGVAFQREAPWARSTFWLSTVLIDPAALASSARARDSRSLLKAMAGDGIQCRPLWQPLHESAAFPGAESFAIDGAVAVHRQALSLPSSSGLSDADQTRVIAVLRAHLGGASR